MFELLVDQRPPRSEPFAPAAETACGGLLLRAASALPPGPARMAALAEIDPLHCTDHERVDVLRLWEQCQSWVAAQQAVATDAVAADDPRSWVCESRRESARVTVARAGIAPRRNLASARVVARQGSVRRLLLRGEVSLEQVHAVVQETLHLDRETATEVIDRVLAGAGSTTPPALRRKARAAALAADPVAGDLKAEQSQWERRVRKRAGVGVGQAGLEVTGPATGVATIWTALDRLASQSAADDDRTLDQRRFDAMVDLASASLMGDDLRPNAGSPAGGTGHGPGPRRGLRPTVFLYADARTWAGLADNPVDVDGFGPVPAGQARVMFADAAFRVVVTDAVSGVARAVSSTEYRPPARLRRLLHVSDRTCGFPGCGAAVWFCDVEHAVPHDRGGATDACNCGLVCRRHHRLKTFAGWRWRRGPDDRITWTSPEGHHYDRDPVRYLSEIAAWEAFEQSRRAGRASARAARLAADSPPSVEPDGPPPF